MTRFALATVAAALVAGAAHAQTAATPIALGSAAPLADVKMMSVDGREVTIDDVKGAKGTLVVFTCNHCPYAKQWEERVVALGNEFGAKGVGAIAVNSNDPSAYPEDSYASMQERAKERGMKFPYVVDATSDVARAFGASRTPEAFVFDASGKLVYHGTIDDNGRDPAQVKEPYLRNALEAVAAGRSPSVQQTKALGCSIKFRAKS